MAARAAQVAAELPRRRELEGEVVRRVAEGPGEPGARRVQDVAARRALVDGAGAREAAGVAVRRRRVAATGEVGEVERDSLFGTRMMKILHET